MLYITLTITTTRTAHLFKIATTDHQQHQFQFIELEPGDQYYSYHLNQQLISAGNFPLRRTQATLNQHLVNLVNTAFALSPRANRLNLPPTTNFSLVRTLLDINAATLQP